MTNFSISAVTLAKADSGYSFAYDANSLKMNGAETIVYLFNSKTKKVTEFHLTLVYDSKENNTNITLTTVDNK